MPSMAPLSGGNRDGDGHGLGKSNGVPFGGHWGAPKFSSSTVELPRNRKAACALPETRVSK